MRTVLLALLLVSNFVTYAQGLDSTNSKAHELFQKALYKEAQPFYEMLNEKYPAHPAYALRLAECYRLTHQFEQAIPFYKVALKETRNARYYFEYGQVLRGLGRYKEAKMAFVNYQRVSTKKGNHYTAMCSFPNEHQRYPKFEVKNLEGINSAYADFAPTLYKDSLLFSSSRPVEIQVNGKATQTNASFNQLYRAVPAVQPKDWAATPLRKLLGKNINDAPVSYASRGGLVAITSNNFLDGIRQISGSGMLMDIYLYQAKDSKHWIEDSELFFPFNAHIQRRQPFSTGHPCLSADGRTLYFASNRPGGYGGYDIYKSTRTRKGWTEPQNLGYPINTEGDELSPFVAEDGRLFFASNWHAGYGGMDIFTAEDLTFAWGNVQNLGPSINSPADELYFVTDATLRLAYFTSNREGGKGGEDIYQARRIGDFIPREIQRITVGEQLVLGEIHYAPNAARIQDPRNPVFYEIMRTLSDNPNIILQVCSHTDSKGSKAHNLELSMARAQRVVDFLVEKGVNPKQLRAQGFGEFVLENRCKDNVPCAEAEHRANRRTELWVVGQLNAQGEAQITHAPQIPEALLKMEQTLAEKAKEKPTRKSNTDRLSIDEMDTPKRKDHYAIGDYIKVANIYYEFGKAAVNERKSTGLTQILDILKKNPRVVVEIQSHTDAKGAASYNKKLSDRRARAVRDYLVRKGVSTKRLKYKGYGESKILNGCKDGVNCSDEEHAVNRRTEFKVIARRGFKVGEIINVEPITFATNSSRIDLKRSPGLKELITILNDTKISVEVRAHTDARGSSDYNLKLSQRRAKAVYSYLTKKGISRHRLKYKGYGESLPLNKCKDGVPCSGDELRENRRTDFKVIGLR